MKKLLSTVFFAAFAAILLSTATGLSGYVLFGGLMILSIIPKPAGVFSMAITKEIWTQDIVDNLFKDNEFAKRAFNADTYVLQGKVVHIPVAGAPSTVTKNQTNFPQVAVKRTDADITYAIDTYYTTPRHIEKIEQYELSYDKRQSVLGEDQAAMIESAIEGLLYSWMPLVANTVLTTGAVKDPTIAGGTAQVKGFVKAEFGTVKRKMDKASIPKRGRVAVLTADHYNDFLESLSDAERTDVGRVANMAEGVVGRYLGFDIYMRATVGRYRGADGAYVKVDEQDAGFEASDKTNDRAASIFYHEVSTERAQGDVDIFEDLETPTYYGDVYSMTLRMGGRIRRVAGVYAVVEALA